MRALETKDRETKCELQRGEKPRVRKRWKEEEEKIARWWKLYSSTSPYQRIGSLSPSLYVSLEKTQRAKSCAPDLFSPSLFSGGALHLAASLAALAVLSGVWLCLRQCVNIHSHHIHIYNIPLSVGRLPATNRSLYKTHTHTTLYMCTILLG